MKRLNFDLIILGAPAAGKDTQAEILRKQFNLLPIESGKFWRQQAKRNDKVGRLLQRTFSKGHPAPVALMKEFLQDKLKNISRKRDLIFIGNPRLKPEAQLLTKILKKENRDFLVLLISLPEREIRLRSLKRLRDNQDWKYIDNRIKMYKYQIQKTVGYFKSLNRLRTVNGNQTISQVAKDIRKIINDYQRSQGNSTVKRKR